MKKGFSVNLTFIENPFYFLLALIPTEDECPLLIRRHPNPCSPSF
jgi:hypothetical protein